MSFPTPWPPRAIMRMMSLYWGLLGCTGGAAPIQWLLSVLLPKDVKMRKITAVIGRAV